MSSDRPSSPSHRGQVRGSRAYISRARLALGYCLALFAGSQLLLIALTERWMPGLRDPEYGVKQAQLNARLSGAGERPLVLFMGTSRTLSGIDPAVLPVLSGQAPLVYNFAHSGAGPLHQLVYLRRLLQTGPRPTHIFLEMIPALLCHHREARDLLDQGHAGWRDWGTLSDYWPEDRSRAAWCAENLVPCVSQRFSLLGQVKPRLLSKPQRNQWIVWSWIDRGGFLNERRNAVSPAEYEQGLKHAHEEYAWLLNRFRISPVADRALREFLAVAREQAIPVTLYLMPEASRFRAWYAPHAEAALRGYLDGVSREFGTTVVDARLWVDDGGFADGHHLLTPAARDFSRRFGREVFLPALERTVAHRRVP
jgi:hypothetical protein